MKKTNKKINDLEMFWQKEGTASVKLHSPGHKIRQSINQKVERSEEDIKQHFREVLIPLTVISCLTLLLSFVNLVR